MITRIFFMAGALGAALLAAPLRAEVAQDPAVAACIAIAETGAAQACTAVVGTTPADPSSHAWAWNNLGLIRAAGGDMLGALKAYDRALGLDANFAAAFSNRGNAHAALGDMLAALADHDKALALDPAYVSALHNRGVDHEEMGFHRKALQDYRAVLKLDPDHSGSHVGIATASCKLGRVKASAEARLRAIERGHLDATEMQELLKREGHYRGPIDGIFGRGSRAALRAWTRKGCLPAA